MNTVILIHSKHTLDFGDFQTYLEIPNLVLDFISEMPESIHWYFHRKGQSTTLFAINYHLQGTYEVSVDNLASYDDLRFFPYLVDSLAKFLQGKLDLENIYEELDEEWVEDTISEEIASLKANLSISLRLLFGDGISHSARHLVHIYNNIETIPLDVPARLIGGRTLIPLRAVSEAFGCDVQWDKDTRTAKISSKK